ncbi:hypothetical protein BO94DRAFT_117613 [Aspergillus sclerotioniger CBS 115572]|uniref:Uncharacterized protein n=1 Tax=Aspergillus sclerotioniger CBS 115572 TaxID=1450535 RepID=A0A317WCH8_9EURO|nr:hypothetical protein BO94DRAFT_117613 [Aspergillus sclerotioniger CBS 115572]PWY83067.1 hypothetical protein BO94DRAFT_117613 [Aspergillus sclerotioniger CBS 115572]
MVYIRTEQGCIMDFSQFFPIRVIIGLLYTLLGRFIMLVLFLLVRKATESYYCVGMLALSRSYYEGHFI